MNMKKYLLVFALNLLYLSIQAQNVKDANVYPTNLEENMWFESYDNNTRTIKGVNFLVLSDGDNSQDVTPGFTIKLYLYQQGADPIFIKTFEMKGLYHMGSKEYNDQEVSISDEVVPGTYRLGVLVDADDDIKEDDTDNAILFKGEIIIK
jgi:hypothetical protein